VVCETDHRFREGLHELECQALGGLDFVAWQLERALESILNQDAELGAGVVAADAWLDARYAVLHQGVLCLLARPAPDAGDRRLLAALLQISRCLERMGGKCVSIAKLVPLSACERPTGTELLDELGRMVERTISEVRGGRDALCARDLPLAREIVRDGAAVSRLNDEIFTRAVKLGGDVGVREWGMAIVLAARCLERISDNAIAVAQRTMLVATGALHPPVLAAQPI
jgi:phosphate transport system protein